MPSETDSQTSDAFQSLSNHFLIAMPGLHQSSFAHSIIYICEHGPEGSMGLVINHPLDISLSEIFDQFDLNYQANIGNQPLLSGGPVQLDRGFVLHRPAEKRWESTVDIASDVCLTASKDIIADMAASNGPRDALITLGYSGWGAGQLEQELVTNSWLTVPADSDIIFNTPFEQRAQLAASRIGIDMSLLSTDAGHA